MGFLEQMKDMKATVAAAPSPIHGAELPVRAGELTPDVSVDWSRAS